MASLMCVGLKAVVTFRSNDSDVLPTVSFLGDSASTSMPPTITRERVGADVTFTTSKSVWFPCDKRDAKVTVQITREGGSWSGICEPMDIYRFAESHSSSIVVRNTPATTAVVHAELCVTLCGASSDASILKLTAPFHVAANFTRAFHCAGAIPNLQRNVVSVWDDWKCKLPVGDSEVAQECAYVRDHLVSRGVVGGEREASPGLGRYKSTMRFDLCVGLGESPTSSAVATLLLMQPKGTAPLSKNSFPRPSVIYGGHDDDPAATPAPLPHAMYHVLLMLCSGSSTPLPPLQAPLIAQALRDIADEHIKNTLEAFFRPYMVGLRQSDQGVLFFGKPGTGKSFRFNVFRDAGFLTLFDAPCSMLVSSYKGGSARNLAAVYDHALLYSAVPCVIFLDEVDALAGSTSAGAGGGEVGGSSRDLISFLQTAMTSQQHRNVLVVASTNFKASLGEALLRPGRFGCHVYFAGILPSLSLTLLRDMLLRHFSGRPVLTEQFRLALESLPTLEGDTKRNLTGRLLNMVYGDIEKVAERVAARMLSINHGAVHDRPLDGIVQCVVAELEDYRALDPRWIPLPLVPSWEMAGPAMSLSEPDSRSCFSPFALCCSSERRLWFCGSDGVTHLPFSIVPSRNTTAQPDTVLLDFYGVYEALVNGVEYVDTTVMDSVQVESGFESAASLVEDVIGRCQQRCGDNGAALSAGRRLMVLDVDAICMPTYTTSTTTTKTNVDEEGTSLVDQTSTGQSQQAMVSTQHTNQHTTSTAVTDTTSHSTGGSVSAGWCMGGPKVDASASYNYTKSTAKTNSVADATSSTDVTGRAFTVDRTVSNQIGRNTSHQDSTASADSVSRALVGDADRFRRLIHVCRSPKLREACRRASMTIGLVSSTTAMLAMVAEAADICKIGCAQPRRCHACQQLTADPSCLLWLCSPLHADGLCYDICQPCFDQVEGGEPTMQSMSGGAGYAFSDLPEYRKRIVRRVSLRPLRFGGGSLWWSVRPRIVECVLSEEFKLTHVDLRQCIMDANSKAQIDNLVKSLMNKNVNKIVVSPPPAAVAAPAETAGVLTSLSPPGLSIEVGVCSTTTTSVLWSATGSLKWEGSSTCHVEIPALSKTYFDAWKAEHATLGLPLGLLGNGLLFCSGGVINGEGISATQRMFEAAGRPPTILSRAKSITHSSGATIIVQVFGSCVVADMQNSSACPPVWVIKGWYPKPRDLHLRFDVPSVIADQMERRRSSFAIAAANFVVKHQWGITPGESTSDDLQTLLQWAP